MLTTIINTVFIAAVAIIVISVVRFSIINGISPMPSSSKARRKVASLLGKSGIRGPIVEAGSGWGNLALFLARRFPEHRFIALENSPFPLWYSQMTARFLELTNMTIIRQNLYDYDYGQSGAIVCYLYPGAMERLSKQFRQLTNPDIRIISICFALPGWSPEQVVTCDDLYQTKVYVYRRGA